MNYVRFFRDKVDPNPARLDPKTSIAPLSAKDFLVAQAAGRSLHRVAAFETPMAIFDIHRLRAALQRTRNDAPDGFSVDAHFRQNREDVLFKIEYDQIGQLLDAGATLCVANIHLADEDLRSFASALKAQLRFAGIVGINCYLSPAGGGLRRHYDTKTAIIIQLSGEKNWRFAAKPTVPFPRRAARERFGKIHYGEVERYPLVGWERAARLRRASLKRARLHPGDILSLPPGTWHEAQAPKESLSLNVYLQPIDFGDMLSEILFERMSQRAVWRGGPPMVPLDPIENPKLVREYFSSRLRELKNEIDRLTKDDRELWDKWREYTEVTD